MVMPPNYKSLHRDWKKIMIADKQLSHSVDINSAIDSRFTSCYMQ